MAKKLISRYTFDPVNDTVILDGIYALERILLITNTSTNDTIFQFNSTTKGIVSHSVSAENKSTTLVLQNDCDGMNANDTLQCFVEMDYQFMEPSESFVDPVNKLRVTNPQNLIDTDFEYGLQGSKWETLELVNNIPGFYANQADYILPDVISVQTTTGAENITVSTLDNHGIAVGSPIDVQGLGVRTAEGKFLVTKVPSLTSFVYKSKGVQQRTENLVGSYTTITPGQFYAASQINFDQSLGLATDGAQQSTLKITTDYTHGFDVGSSLYFTNTIGSTTFNIPEGTGSPAPDGNIYIDYENTTSKAFTLNSQLTETKEMIGTYAHKFGASAINPIDNTITWPNHQLRPGDVLLFSPSAGDTPPGGLFRFEVYYVKSAPTANTITLCETTGGNYGTNPVIDITSQGTSDYGRHELLLGYEISRLEKRANDYNNRLHTRYAIDGSGSGWDLIAKGQTTSRGRSGYFGLGGVYPNRVVAIARNGYTADTNHFNLSYFPYYSTSVNPGYTTRKSASDGYEFTEDFKLFENYQTIGRNNWHYFDNNGIIRLYVSGGYNYSLSQTTNLADDTMFFFPLDKDAEADTFYAADHGLGDNTDVTFTTTSGQSVKARVDTSTQYNSNPVFATFSSPYQDRVRVISTNRFKLQNASRLHTASGVYSTIGARINPTGDTIYLGDYDLVDGEEMTFTEGVDAVFPTTVGGAIEPDNNGTLTTIYNSVKSTLDAARVTMGTEAGLLYYNGFAHYYPFNSYNDTFDGGRQYFYASMSQVNVYSPVFNTISDSLSNDNYATGTEYALFAGTALEGKGYKLITTPWTQNTTTPYHVNIFQIPADQDVLGANSYSRLYLSGNSYNYSGSVSRDNRQNDYNTSGAWPSLGNGWRYEYEALYRAPDSTYHGFISLTVVIDNSDWSGYYENYDGDIRYLGSSSRSVLMQENSNRAGQRYVIHAILPIKAGSNSSNYSLSTGGAVLPAATLANNIATDISNTLTRSTLTSGQSETVFAKVVNGQRISLANAAGVTYDFTGTGNGPFTLKTAESIGGADGYYDVTQSTDTEMDFSLGNEVPKRVVNFTDASLVVFEGVDHISATEHRFQLGQKVTFASTSDDSIIDGLNEDTEYFAIPVGPDYLLLAETYEAAITNSPLTIAANANNVAPNTYTLTSGAISGISPGDGLVDITEGSNKILGVDTLFKRYFKPGDTIRFADTSNTPTLYYEDVVATVIDDTELSLVSPARITETETSYFVETQINVRPDGSFLHRPFDGGVEINAGTSPNSSIVRQTRKYFRYQSGKGIQVSLAINFNPSRTALRIESSGTTATVHTEYPHGIIVGNSVTIKGCDDDVFNGTFVVNSKTDFTFSYTLPSTPLSEVPNGIIRYNITAWANSLVRAGLFDYQNGMFFEFDGHELYTVRRSSVTQLPGSVNAQFGSNKIFGNNTSFVGQLAQEDHVVIRGVSYKITKVVSDTELHIQPSYKGITTSKIIVTKTEDARIPQSEWNVDICDGTGPSGFILDTTKIQMAYIDYSWYGAGKIRFGFKDTYGHVKYVHEFIHNNVLEEAYMRSGNIPGRYEIFNNGTPTFVPGLFHWGTSIIMDGKFDDDKAYLFTAASNSLTFTNGDTTAANTNATSTLVRYYNYGLRQYDWYVRLRFPSSAGSAFSTNTPLYTADEELNGEQVTFTQYSGSNIYVFIFMQTSSYRNPPAVYPNVGSGTEVNIGAPAGGGSDVDLTNPVPLISIRLAPSVDNNLSGAVGAREIINRMQLQLKSLGITLSHDCNVALILNGSVDNVTYSIVGSPSLSELLKHNAGDRVIGGSEIFSFRASGGNEDAQGKRLPVTSEFDLSQITDLGNSILGGDGVFPNGPDLLTIAAVPIDTSQVNSASPLVMAGRITWTESQA
jgi:hypothetical protein